MAFQPPHPPPPGRTVTSFHNAGFFSCCTVLLHEMVKYYNTFRVYPERIDATGTFMWYKNPADRARDVRPDYFMLLNEATPSPTYEEHGPIRITNESVEDQFSNYQRLNHEQLRPLMERYFAPSAATCDLVERLCTKYHVDYDQTCVLFHRGNDKVKEVDVPGYQEYVDAARQLLNQNPGLRFLVQSDETEFLDAMKAEFPTNHVIFYDEIRHIPSNPTTLVDKVFPEQNAVMSKNFLAITLMMSRCKYVVCGSGNCSFWVALFRGHGDGLVQFNYLGV